jgi:hypothetical protein
MAHIPIPHDSPYVIAVEGDLDTVPQNQVTTSNKCAGLDTAAEILGREANRHLGWGKLDVGESHDLAIGVSQSSPVGTRLLTVEVRALVGVYSFR